MPLNLVKYTPLQRALIPYIIYIFPSLKEKRKTQKTKRGEKDEIAPRPRGSIRI
jgi:hypothetical protein